MSRAIALLVVSLVGLLAAPSSAAARAAWLRPVAGPVAHGYHFDAARRFARGWHRGADFAASAGAIVRAPCGGPVLWAGAVGATGRGVTIGCGSLNATLTRLGAVAVRRGAVVVPGQPVGRTGAHGVVQLGARVRRRPAGYLDPLRLIGAAPRPPLPGPLAPRARRPRPSAPRPAPAPTPLPAPAPAPAAARAHAGIPVGGLWLPVGLAVLVTATGIGAVRAAPARARAALARPVRRLVALRRAR